MSRLKGLPSAQLLLLTVELEDWHWVASVEVFLESRLEVQVRAKRAG